MMASVAEGAALTEPASVIGVESASVNPPPLVNAPSVVTALPRLGRFVVAPELPDSEPATMEPPVWSIGPAAFSATLVEPAMLPPLWVMAPLVVVSATVGAVMLPDAAIGPAAPMPMPVVSVTGPVMPSPLPSARVNPPTLEKLPSVVTALVADGSEVVAPDEPDSAPALNAPPVWSIDPAATSVTPVLPTMLPPATSNRLPTAGTLSTKPELAVSSTSGAVRLPATVSGPVLVSAIEVPSVTGPVTVNDSPLVSANPLLAVNDPSVPTRLPGWSSVAAPAEPVSTGVVIAPAPASVMVPLTARFTVAPDSAPPMTRLPVSAKSKSPELAAKAPSVPTTLAGEASDTEVPLPVSTPARIVPPGSLIVPAVA